MNKKDKMKIICAIIELTLAIIIIKIALILIERGAPYFLNFIKY